MTITMTMTTTKILTTIMDLGTSINGNYTTMTDNDDNNNQHGRVERSIFFFGNLFGLSPRRCEASNKPLLVPAFNLIRLKVSPDIIYDKEYNLLFTATDLRNWSFRTINAGTYSYKHSFVTVPFTSWTYS